MNPEEAAAPDGPPPEASSRGAPEPPRPGALWSAAAPPPPPLGSTPFASPVPPPPAALPLPPPPAALPLPPALPGATPFASVTAPGPAIPFAIPASASEAPVTAVAKPPRIGETVSGSLDLALAASRRVRRASIYVGIVTLALVGPVAILFLALVRHAGGFEEAVAMFEKPVPDLAATQAMSLIGVASFIAALGLFGILIEGQIMAAAIVGGAASGRQIGLRRSLRLSRIVFWRVVGSALVVGILDRAVTFTIAAILGGSTGATEASTLVEVAAAGLVTMPFGFFQAGIILGGVGAMEALRRSVRIARARWRLALLVALAGILLGYIEVFALGAGLDLVLRFADAVGLGFNEGALMATVSVLVVLACIVAVGSLVVTIAALVAAPQIFVFVKMTGFSAGLDRAMAAPWPEPTKPPRLVTWPMLGVIVLGFVCALFGIASL
jgi:hypothetical protein